MQFETKPILETVQEGHQTSKPDIDLSFEDDDLNNKPRYGRARFSYDLKTKEGIILLAEKLDYFNSISSCIHEFGHIYDFSIDNLHTKLKPLEEVDYRFVTFTPEEIDHLRNFFNDGVDLPFHVVVDISKKVLKKIVKDIPDDLPIEIKQTTAKEMDKTTVQEANQSNNEDEFTMTFDVDDKIFKRREVVATFLEIISVIVLENSLRHLGWLKYDIDYNNLDGPVAYRRVKNIAYGLLQRGLVPTNSKT